MKKALLFIIFLILCSGLIYSQNQLLIGDQSVTPAQIFYVPIEVNNSDSIVALQLDINIPDAFSFIEESLELNPDRKNDHELQYSVLDGGKIRILCYSSNNLAFKSNSGWLVRFQLQAGSVPGNYSFSPENVFLGNSESTNVHSGTSPGSIQIMAPEINIATSELNFGETAVSQQTSRSFTIQNNGTQLLSISDIELSDNQFISNQQLPFNIAVGQSSSVNIAFTPTWKGSFEFPILIKSNDPDEPELELDILAQSYTINEIHIGSMFSFSGDEAELIVSINNMEAFTGIQFDLTLPDPLKYIEGSIAFVGRNTNHEVSAEQIGSNQIRVLAYSDENSNFTGNDGDLIKLNFEVCGTGGNYSIPIFNGMIGHSDGTNILSAEFGGSLQVAAADISCPNSMNFGEVSSLEEKRLNVQLNNFGSDELLIENVQCSDTSFRNETSIPFTIPVNQNSNISVKYQNIIEGVHEASLSIYSNDPDENPIRIQLSGETFTPNYLIIPNQVFKRNQDIWVEVWAENQEPFIALQFDLHYPSELFTCLLDDAELTNRLSNHELQITETEAGTIKVLAYSMNQTAVTGDNGCLVRLKFMMESLTFGTYNFTLLNAILGNASSENILHDVRNGQITISPNSDASLSDLKVDGTTIIGFDSTTLNYTLELAYGTTTIPTVTATATDSNAEVVITEATELPGTTTVLVTAEDGTTQTTYGVSFTIAPNSDATLSDLKVDGTTVSSFDPSTLNYTQELPFGTTSIPAVTSTATDSNAEVVITEATELPGTTTVLVTAEDGSTQKTYRINFTIALNTDATLSDLKVDGTTVSSFDPSTLNYTQELPSGTTTIPTVTATATDSNAEFVITEAIELPGTTTVEVTAEDGTTQKTYSINFTLTNVLTYEKSMVEGWNWFSVYLVNDSMDLNQILTSLNLQDGDYIKDRKGAGNSSTYYDQAGFKGWFPLLEIDPKETYKMRLTNAGDLVYQGSPFDFENEIIGVNAGWNWIGYPLCDPMSVEDYLASLNNVENDYLKNQWVSTTYYSGYGWYGQLEIMQAGDGYVMKVANDGSIQGSEFNQLKSILINKEYINNVENSPYHLNVNDFQYTGSAMIEILDEGVEKCVKDHVLHAFNPKGKCVGMVNALYYPMVDKYLFNLMIYSNEEEGEEICFKMYSSREEKWYEFEETLLFSSDMIVATAYHPYILKTVNKEKESVMDDLEMRVYPNPFTDHFYCEFNNDKNQQLKISIVSSAGKVIKVIECRDYPAGKHSISIDGYELVPAVYYLKFEIKNEIKTIPLIKRE